MHITPIMLERASACRHQFLIFYKEWPAGVDISKGTVARAKDLGLDLNWAAVNLLSEPDYDKYVKIMEKPRHIYEEATTSALMTHDTDTEAAREKLQKAADRSGGRATDSDCVVYNKTTAGPKKICSEALAEARQAYVVATADAILEAVTE